MVESERGCGWRKEGGVYLVGDGASAACDALPLNLCSCSECEFDVVQARSVVPYHAGYLASKLKGHDCKDDFPCPFCFFGKPYQDLKAEAIAKGEKFNGPKVFFLMWVSQDFYTPAKFVKEATEHGVSKRIAPNSLPTGFVVGRDWIYLAHRDVPFPAFVGDAPIVAGPDGEPTKGPKKAGLVTKRGIFFAFKPKAVEVMLWDNTPRSLIEEYEDLGYNVVLLERTEENIKRHGDKVPPTLTQRVRHIDDAKEGDDDESGDE